MAIGTRREKLQVVKKRVDIPAELVFRFERLPANFDPARGEAIYGRWSQVMTRLLESYIHQEESKLGEANV